MPDHPAEPFSARLARLRGAAGLSVPALAILAGMDRALVYRLERGERPNPYLETADRLARALGVSLSAFDGCEW